MTAIQQTRYRALSAVEVLLKGGSRPIELAGDAVPVYTQRQPQIGDSDDVAITVQLVRDERQWDLECSQAQRWHLTLQVGVLQRQLCDAAPLANVLEQVVAKLAGAMNDATFRAALPEMFDVRCGEIEWASLTPDEPAGSAALVRMELRYRRYS